MCSYFNLIMSFVSKFWILLFILEIGILFPDEGQRILSQQIVSLEIRNEQSQIKANETQLLLSCETFEEISEKEEKEKNHKKKYKSDYNSTTNFHSAYNYRDDNASLLVTTSRNKTFVSYSFLCILFCCLKTCV